MNRTTRRALIKQYANKIMQLERLCQEDKENAQEYEAKLTELTSNLTLEEMLVLDGYIMEKLTK